MMNHPNSTNIVMLPSKSATPLFIVSIFLLIASCIEKQLKRGNNFDAVSTDPNKRIYSPHFCSAYPLNNPSHTPFDCCIKLGFHIKS